MPSGMAQVVVKARDTADYRVAESSFRTNQVINHTIACGS